MHTEELIKLCLVVLKKVLSNEWLNNSNNYIIKISTEKENSL